MKPLAAIACTLSLLLGGCTTIAVDDLAGTPQNPLLGVNLSGAEFASSVQGTPFTHYVYPSAADFAYFANHGFSLIRLPFLWERLQPELFGPLDKRELTLIRQSVDSAGQYNLKVILDIHNYGSYKKARLGSPELPQQALADVWKKLAKEFNGNPHIWAYGLMNEPNGLPQGVWPAAAQAAINAIRTQDATTQILVPGEHWSGAEVWPKVNPEFPLADPSNNLRYEAHTYFDFDNSGTYQKPFAQDGATVARAEQRLTPFIEWLKQHNAKGFVGEYGTPASAEWQPILARAVQLMKQNDIPSTYWSAGPWWGNYPLSIQPDTFDPQTPKPQLRTLLQTHKN